jgi:hypothetical protein
VKDVVLGGAVIGTVMIVPIGCVVSIVESARVMVFVLSLLG